MKVNAVTALLLSLVLVCLFATAFSADDKFQFGKQPAIQQVRFKKPVRIKLKRLADGKYTWDLTGDDTDEIVKVDKRLRKLLRTE